MLFRSQDDHYLGNWSTDPEHVMSAVPGPLQKKIGPTDATGIWNKGGPENLGQPAQTGIYVPSPNAKTAINNANAAVSTPRNLQNVFMRIQALEQHLERVETMLMQYMKNFQQQPQG